MFVTPSAGVSFSAIKSLSSEPEIPSSFTKFPHLSCSFGYKSQSLSSAIAGDVSFVATGIKSEFYNIEAAYILTSLYFTQFFDLIILDASIFTSFGGFASAKIYETKSYNEAYEMYFGFDKVLKNYDAGLYTAIGATYKNFVFRVNSSLGLLNLYAPTTLPQNPKLYSMMVSINLGYRFDISKK